MPPRRSPAITFLGVANMVLGTLGILCACANGGWILFASLISGNEPDDPLVKDLTAPWNFVVQNVPGYFQIETAMAIFHLAISILAILSGIGLLALKKWGRVLAVLYGLTVIVIEGAYLLYFFAFVSPVLNRFEGPQGGSLLGSGMLDAFGSLFVMAYAAVLVIVLFLPTVAADFARDHVPEEDW